MFATLTQGTEGRSVVGLEFYLRTDHALSSWCVLNMKRKSPPATSKWGSSYLQNIRKRLGFDQALPGTSNLDGIQYRIVMCPFSHTLHSCLYVSSLTTFDNQAMREKKDIRWVLCTSTNLPPLSYIHLLAKLPNYLRAHNYMLTFGMLYLEGKPWHDSAWAQSGFIYITYYL